MSLSSWARRALLVLTTILLGLVTAIPASALTQPSSRRHHYGAHIARRHRRRHRHRRVLQRSQGASVQGTISGSPDACPNSGASATAASLQTMRAAVVCEINLKRSAHGLPPLREAGALDNSAQGWSQTMVATNQFTHGASFSDRITAAGYSWAATGENIASGYLTPQAVVSAWMGSLDHCRNILMPSFRDVGIGEVPAGVGAGSAATWTADFGLPLLSSPPSSNWGPADGCPY